jgi:hypothetical protein
VPEDDVYLVIERETQSCNEACNQCATCDKRQVASESSLTPSTSR